MIIYEIILAIIMIGSISYCKTSSGAEVGIIVWAMLGLFPCLFRINSNNGNNYMVNGKDIRLDVNKYYNDYGEMP